MSLCMGRPIYWGGLHSLDDIWPLSLVPRAHGEKALFLSRGLGRSRLLVGGIGCSEPESECFVCCSHSLCDHRREGGNHRWLHCDTHVLWIVLHCCQCRLCRKGSDTPEGALLCPELVAYIQYSHCNLIPRPHREGSVPCDLGTRIWSLQSCVRLRQSLEVDCQARFLYTAFLLYVGSATKL